MPVEALFERFGINLICFSIMKRVSSIVRQQYREQVMLAQPAAALDPKHQQSAEIFQVEGVHSASEALSPSMTSIRQDDIRAHVELAMLLLLMPVMMGTISDLW